MNSEGAWIYRAADRDFYYKNDKKSAPCLARKAVRFLLYFLTGLVYNYVRLNSNFL